VLESIGNNGLSRGFASHYFIGHTRLRGVGMLMWISQALVTAVIKTRSHVGRSWKLDW
jgi:hypothetical protein